MPGTIQSVERAAAALRLLAAGRALSLQEVAGALGLAKATAHGLLRTLVEVGFVEQDARSGAYRLGNGLQRLGEHELDPHTLRSYAMNWADSLAGITGEAVRVSVLDGAAARVVHHVLRPDDTPQPSQLGLRLPLHASAAGKVLLATRPSQLEGAGPFDAFTRRTLTSAEELARTIQLVRRHGYAVEVEEHEPGLAGVAAPVRGRGGLVVGAVEVVGSVERLCDARPVVHPEVVRQVRQTAAAVSREVSS